MSKKQNVIEVGFKKKVQPVRIGGMNFEINLSQKSQKNMQEKLPKIYEELEEARGKLEDLSKANDLLGVLELEDFAAKKIEEMTDIMLGEGAYSKIFEAADEDVYVVAEAMMEVSDKFKILQTKNKAQSFIDGKKR